MTARIRLQPEAVGMGMTSQRVRDRLIERLREQNIRDERVLNAIRTVPRHLFVDEAFAARAYEDNALPIGHGQTISQPWVVARMTEALFERDAPAEDADTSAGDDAPRAAFPPKKVLEVGTGSGYQAAILRELTGEVYTVEIIPELAATARAVLDRLGYADIHIDRRDGYYGWEEYAPYDAIIVTAAPDHLPQPLAAQLTDGGRMVIPIGPVGNVQTLWLVTREGDEVSMERLLDVMFVPFTRESE